MGGPSLLFYEGCLKWQQGKRQAALKDWGQSAASAGKLAMPWDQGNALREIGRRSAGEMRSKNLQEALALFNSSGAVFDTLDAKKLMEK
jgi:hypothetical protein